MSGHADAEPCTHRWYGDPDGLTWSHWCAEVGPHDTHRCCCGASKRTEQSAGRNRR